MLLLTWTNECWHVSKIFSLSTLYSPFRSSFSSWHCIFLVSRFVSNVSQLEVNFWSVRNYPHRRTLPVGSELAADHEQADRKFFRSTNNAIDRRAFFVSVTFLLWRTRWCHGLLVVALIGLGTRETLEAWGCAYNTSLCCFRGGENKHTRAE